MPESKLRPWSVSPLAWSLSVALLAAPASATEWLNGTQLARHCGALLGESRDGDGELCVSFVQGYLAGAEAVRELVAIYSGPPSALTEDRTETFRERAARTRAGSHLDNVPIAGEAPSYCLPEDVGARTVIEHISAHLEERTGEIDLTATQALHRALVRRFPCEEGG
jgi:hypothetical protein